MMLALNSDELIVAQVNSIRHRLDVSNGHRSNKFHSSSNEFFKCCDRVNDICWSLIWIYIPTNFRDEPLDAVFLVRAFFKAFFLLVSMMPFKFTLLFRYGGFVYLHRWLLFIMPLFLTALFSIGFLWFGDLSVDDPAYVFTPR